MISPADFWKRLERAKTPEFEHPLGGSSAKKDFEKMKLCSEESFEIASLLILDIPWIGILSQKRRIDSFLLVAQRLDEILKERGLDGRQMAIDLPKVQTAELYDRLEKWNHIQSTVFFILIASSSSFKKAAFAFAAASRSFDAMTRSTLPFSARKFMEMTVGV